MTKKQNKNLPKDEIVIYKSPGGKMKLDVKMQADTVWLAQKQIALLFGTQRPAITKHLKNIFKSSELSQESVSSILEHTAADGKMYKTQFYNLDAIIAVGYRVNSKRATQFRIWATRVLRDHIVKGFTINEKRLKNNSLLKLNELEKAVNLLKSAAGNKKLSATESAGLLSVITDYASAWILLQKYDQGKLKVQAEKKKISKTIDYDGAKHSIQKLKSNLKSKKEASDLFGRESGGGLERILASVEQTFDGKALYPSLEEKSAHLLYFIIKDHPFVDGNKRIASFLFIVFLVQNNFLLNKKGEKKINDNALVALALLGGRE